jgi:hypothetical protein
MKTNFIEFPFIPITKRTFERQEWEEHTDTDGEDEEGNPITYTYYVLPLPKDNPDKNAPSLISCASDEWDELGIPKGHFVIEICDLAGLGFCKTEEELIILYRCLTGEDIE